jgi:predicted DNA-binding transcriptional regulator YafY
MSYGKADQLLQLATLVSSRRQGLCLEEMCEIFSVSHRTAQRMTRALELQFPDVETVDGADGKKRWRLGNAELRDLISLTAEELAALELAVNTLERSGMAPEAQALRHLQDKILSLIPRTKVRLEPDYEALLEAQGFIARPGPKPRVNNQVHAKLVEAIKACRRVTIRYRSNYDAEDRPRKLAPLGFLSGTRRYLVAQDSSSTRGPIIKTYRVDNILSAAVTNEHFTRPADFDLQSFANKAFGVFQRDDEITNVIWRFAPEAAEHARAYQFHPDQTEELAEDGSLLVKFMASGFLEMAWYLYQ